MGWVELEILSILYFLDETDLSMGRTCTYK